MVKFPASLILSISWASLLTAWFPALQQSNRKAYITRTKASEVGLLHRTTVFHLNNDKS